MKIQLYYGSNEDMMSFFIQVIQQKYNCIVITENDFIKTYKSLLTTNLFQEKTENIIITNITDKFLKYYEEVSQSINIFLFSLKIRTNSKLLNMIKTINANNIIKCYDFSDYQKINILKKTINIKMNNEAMNLFIQNLNPKYWMNNIKKLSILKKEITNTDILKYCYFAQEEENNIIFDLADGNINILKKEISLEPIVMIRSIIVHFNKILLAKTNPEKKQNIFFKFEKQFYHSVKTLSELQINNIINIAINTEIIIKITQNKLAHYNMLIKILKIINSK